MLSFDKDSHNIYPFKSLSDGSMPPRCILCEGCIDPLVSCGRSYIQFNGFRWGYDQCGPCFASLYEPCKNTLMESNACREMNKQAVIKTIMSIRLIGSLPNFHIPFDVINIIVALSYDLMSCRECL